MLPKDIKREYVFSTYVKSKVDGNKDALIVKEIIHTPNEEPKRVIRVVENYKRPYWITKPEFRKHSDKREFESVDRCDMFMAKQNQLADDIFSRLNGYRSNREVRLNEVSSSQYLYGSDITSNDLLKQDYVNKFGKMFTPSSVAIMDYEWDVSDPKEPIIAGIVSMKETVHIAIVRSWLGDIADYAEDRIRSMCNKYHGKLIQDRNIKLKLTIEDSPAKVVIALMKTVHELRPDFLAFWSIEGDIEHMLKALKDANIDPALVFSDPKVPNEYKDFIWKKDPPFKLKANGERMSKSPSERWHTVYTPSSFYCICAMSAFRAIRAREQQRSSYGLDAILHEFLDIGKMKFDSIPEGITGKLWHQIMQKKHKIEYMVYLFGDGVFVELLNEKTKDLSESIRPQADTSSFDKFKSNPRRLATDFHFVMLTDNKVVGSTDKTMVTKLDAEIPSTKGWIITLAAELEEGLGMPVIKEYPTMSTNITLYAFDEDLTSAYPSGGLICNVSKDTNTFVLCKIEGLTKHQTRELGINLTSVVSNPLSLARRGFNFPDIDVLYNEFMEEYN